MKDIISIYSGEEDLIFLIPLITFLKNLFNEKIEIYELDTSIESHTLAQIGLKKSKPNTLIIILCHGGSNYILGNKNIVELNVDTDYYELLSGKNIDIIENKKLLCLSCNSKEGLGNLVINNGGLGLIGFGDIMFDDPLRIKKEGFANKEVQEVSKSIMVSILSETIEICFNTNASIKNFVNYFKLITNKHCDKILLENKGNTTYLRAANFLWNLKHEICYFGDGNILIFD